MTKTVFDTRASSGYDDDIAHRYHFPDRYLPDASKAVGDWVVYREPRRNGGMADTSIVDIGANASLQLKHARAARAGRLRRIYTNIYIGDLSHP